MGHPMSVGCFATHRNQTKPDGGASPLKGITITTKEFMNKMLELHPDAVLGEDEDGQLIIHTGLMEREDGQVVGLKLDLETDQ